MRLLSVHNTYQIRGGEDESRESEEKLLREHGHTVDVYEETNDRISSLNPAQLAIKTVWSQETYKSIHRQLKQQSYDAVHVQNFFPLISPAVHYAAKQSGIPIVQTLRNYRLLCPNALFFRDGKVCEDCLGKAIPYPGVLHSCYRESAAASAAVATMISTHKALNTWTKNVDLFITLTEFSRQKFIQGGFPADKIVVKPNFVYPDPGLGSGQGSYALYVGRLSVEKGIDTLIDAWEQMNIKIPLKIVGDGPLAGLVQEAARRLPQLEPMGRRPLAEVHQLMGDAKCLIFPSKWYETFGRVAVESFAKGTPVIASKIGAIEELVDSGETGIHFEAGNASDLARRVTQFWRSPPQQTESMRKAARAQFEEKFTPAQNYRFMMKIYETAKKYSKAQLSHR